MDPDDEPIVKLEQQTYIVYKSRWFILTIYGLLITFQGSLWNTWGPLHDNMELAYNWDSVTFGLLPFWGPFCYVLSFLPWTWLMNSKGLRLPVLLSAGLVLAGCLAKLPAPFVSDDLFRILCHVCGFLNGLAAPALFTTPPMLAAIWFPRNERVTATAIGGSCQGLAIAASFIIGPLFVPEVSNSTLREANSTDIIIENIKSEVYVLNYSQLGIALAIFAVILAYFPNRPPTPPAVSCEVERVNLAAGLKSLSINTWLVVMAYGLPLGVSAGFSAAFDVNVSQYGIGQTQAGWMGFVAVLTGTVVSLLAARLIDWFPNASMKWFNIVFLGVATLCYVWFTLIFDKVLPGDTASIYVANVLANTALYSSLPLFYEMACESAFPIAEEVPAMLITSVNCFFASVFLALFFFPQIGTLWMNYVMTGACATAVPLLVLFREVHNRRNLDLTAQVGAQSDGRLQ
ncbi:hypothetical protein BOX15_Mlig023460g1 [Macrostomum lignano]|uniref:MFS domain-containing protein n=1 Tax=Macrostomum lignano TaxID=282301 RepID=A0A267F267_9PLAT|nr:hypothetical protein BOX15_Mlig023460g1 [Macrostomum lignano]